MAQDTRSILLGVGEEGGGRRHSRVPWGASSRPSEAAVGVYVGWAPEGALGTTRRRRGTPMRKWSALWTQDPKDLCLLPSETREGVCWGDVFECFSVHTNLFLAQRSRMCKVGCISREGQEVSLSWEIHKFLAADACFNFHAWRSKLFGCLKVPPAGLTFFPAGLYGSCRPSACASVVSVGPK